MLFQIKKTASQEPIVHIEPEGEWSCDKNGQIKVEFYEGFSWASRDYVALYKVFIIAAPLLRYLLLYYYYLLLPSYGSIKVRIRAMTQMSSALSLMPASSCSKLSYVSQRVPCVIRISSCSGTL